MINLTADYTPKILHVGISNPRTVAKKDSSNGLVYDPTKVYSKINTTSEIMYENFFNSGSEIVILPVRTEQGPGELVKILEKDFGIDYSTWIGGIIAEFTATPEQAQRIIKAIKSNPKRYFASQEKKDFAGISVVF